MFAQSNGKMIIIGKGSGTFLCQMFSVIDRSRVSDLDHITGESSMSVYSVS